MFNNQSPRENFHSFKFNTKKAKKSPNTLKQQEFIDYKTGVNER